MTTISVLIAVPAQLEGAQFIPLNKRTKEPVTGWKFKGENGRTFTVEGGEPLGDGRYGVLMGNSGLLVADCEIPGDAHPGVTGKGEDTLVRIAQGAKVKLPRTFTILSQSGGKHYYFRQHPACPLKTKPLLNMDLKASVNSYCAIGAGYMVIDDSPVAEIPLE